MELSDLMTTLERRFKPYRETSPTFARLPEIALKRGEILEEVGRLGAAEEERWRRGYASGAVYHGDPEFIGFLADPTSMPASPRATPCTRTCGPAPSSSRPRWSR